jgi:hypothetical protein
VWRGLAVYRARCFTRQGATSRRLPDLFPEFGREFDDIAVQFVIFALGEEFAKPHEFLLAFFEELDGFVDDVAGVDILARGDELFDFGFDLG